MKIIPLLSVFVLLPLSSQVSSQVSYYNSNRSGMLLNEITISERDEYYIKKDIDNLNKTIEQTLYKDGKVKKTTKEFFNMDFSRLIRSHVKEGDISSDILYFNGRVSEKKNFKDSILETKEVYKYNGFNELTSIEYFDENDSLIYSDLYYRNIDKSLRKIVRTANEGYRNYWYYKDGNITESWFIDGNLKVRSEFDDNSNIIKKTGFEDEEIIYYEDYHYSIEGILERSVKYEETEEIEKIYNQLGLVLEKNIIENGLLKIKYNNTYKDGYLVKESVGGHGQTEVTEYTLDSEGEPILTEYFVNSKLKRRNIKDGEDSEIIEYYKNDELYLKEFYTHKERVKRELYLDGILFKSENISE